MRPRDYQEAAVAAVLKEFETVRATMVVMATGTGKTVVSGHVANAMLPRGRIMVLCHREELIRQAADKFRQITGHVCAVEKAQEFSDEDNIHGKPPIVISSLQTLCSGGDDRKRMMRFDPKEFAMIWYDEVHHILAKSYRSVVDYFMSGNDELKLLGVTATPDRADGDELSKVIQSVAYNYDISHAIRDGWLVPVRQRSVTIDGLDFTKVRTTAGDLNGSDLEAVMMYEKSLHGIVFATLEISSGLEEGTIATAMAGAADLNDLSPDAVARREAAVLAVLSGRCIKRTLIFCVTVAHAKRVSEILKRWIPKSAESVDGEMKPDDRRGVFERFKTGECSFLAACMVPTEGWDGPHTEIIVLARPTKSRPLCCLDESTEILTPEGWRGIDNPIDSVATFDISNNSIKFEPIIDRITRDTEIDEQWISFHGQHIDFRVTDGHRMIVRSRKGRKKLRTAWSMHRADAAFSGEFIEVPTSGIQPSRGIKISDDEIRFVGLVMTDGSIGKNGAIVISQSIESPMIPEIDRLLNSIGVKFGRRQYERCGKNEFPNAKPTIRWNISSGLPRGTKKHLSGWGSLACAPAITKELSPIFSDATPHQIECLLDGMHIGDGIKNRRHGWKIVTKRKSVADAIQSLCVRRGISCNILHAGSRDQVMYAISCVKHEVRTISRIAGRVVASPTNSERCWCVSTETGTLIARRLGRVMIMGNCQMIGRGTRPTEELAPILGTLPTAQERCAAIASSCKGSLTVLDFVGNCGRHKLVSCADVLGAAAHEDFIIDRAKEIIAEGEIDVEEAIEQAEEEAEVERQISATREEAEFNDMLDEQENRMISARAQVVAVAQYSTRDVNSIEPKREIKPGGASDKQIEFLVKLGVNRETAIGYGARQAGAVITQLKATRCTVGQAGYLRRLGYREDQIKGLNFETAMAAIEAAKNERGVA